MAQVSVLLNGLPPLYFRKKCMDIEIKNPEGEATFPHSKRHGFAVSMQPRIQAAELVKNPSF